MSISQLVNHFERIGKAPILIPDVLAKVKELSLSVKVSLCAVDEPFSELKATIYWYQEDADTLMLMPETCAKIVYSSRMSPEWQKLACCKEMLHILDPDPIKTATKQEVVRLANNMAKKARPNGSIANNLQTFFDQLAKWQAVAVLFPLALRSRFVPLYEADENVTYRIAAYVGVPEECIYVAMQDDWEHFAKTILAFT